MSRILAGAVRLDVQRVALAPVIEGAVESMRPAAGAKGIRLQTVLDPLAAPVKGDPARLQQVVWKLLSNAVKFTGKGGRLQGALERVNSHFEISVSDNGEGIRPEILPRVLDRFTQADRSTTPSARRAGPGPGDRAVHPASDGDAARTPEMRDRRPEGGGRTPAVAVTAFARSTDRTRAMQAGFNMHLAKPVEPAELVSTIANLLQLIN